MFITGRRSRYSTGGFDNFLPGSTPADAADRDPNTNYLEKLLAQDGPQDAVAADLWNAIAEALVAVERKLTGSQAAAPVGLAAGVMVDCNEAIYLCDSIQNRTLAFDQSDVLQASMTHPTKPGALDVAVNDADSAAVDIYVVNGNNGSVDTFSDTGTFKGSFAPSNTKPRGVACAGGYLYIINDYYGARHVDVYNAASHAVVQLQIMQKQKAIKRGQDGKAYSVRIDVGSIWRIVGTTPTFMANIPYSTDNLDVTADSAGNIYILHKSTKSILKFDSSGNAVPADNIDSKGTAWEFVNPTSLDIGPGGEFYVADNGIVKKLDSSGTLLGEFAADNLVHDAVGGSLLVGGGCAPPMGAESSLYPGTTGTSRWKRMIVSSIPLSPNTNKVTLGASVTTADVTVEFSVNPGEIVWPQDIRISVRGGGAHRAYFRRVHSDGLIASDGSKIRLKYTFTLCGMSAVFPNIDAGSYTIDVLGYVSTI